MSDQTVEDNTTRTTARLRGLEIEIIHRCSLNDEADRARDLVLPLDGTSHRGKLLLRSMAGVSHLLHRFV
jgi:hypothetical protein